MAHKNLTGFGEEIVKYEYDGFWDWFITINDPLEFWRAQPTYLLSEAVFLIVGGVLTLKHALRVGGQFPYLWLCTFLHGLVVECAAYWIPDIDNFWHSQTTIVLLGRRLPLHICFLYPTFIYSASVAVSRLRLPKWAEPLAVGLTTVLIDIPYDIMAVNFIHWTWHDTDPNIYDRFYWVPWNSFYFHACFAASLTFWFHFWRRCLTRTKKWEADSFGREMVCTVLAALLGMPGGVILFLPLYHPLHDICGVHSEVTCIILVLIFFWTAWSADRNPTVGSRPVQGQKHQGGHEIALGLLLHYSLYLGMACFGHPEEEVAIGLHETTGPCDQTLPVYTVLTAVTGLVNQKRKYLCISDYDEKYFDFHCLPNGEPPSDGVEWYTICGVPFPNQAEYIAVLGVICFTASMVFFNMLYRSGKEINFNVKHKLKSK